MALSQIHLVISFTTIFKMSHFNQFFIKKKESSIMLFIAISFSSQYFITVFLPNKNMNSLKAALGKDERNLQKMTSNLSVSRRKFSSSKSESMWTLEMDDKEMEVSLDSDKKLALINNLLKSAFEKDNKLSNNTFDRIVEDFQEGLNTSPSKSEISYYLVLEDKTSDLIELNSKNKGQNRQFLDYIEEFHESVEERIAHLRTKDKKDNLRKFDKMIDKQTFKKKPQYLDIGGLKVELSTKSKQKSHLSNSSNQKKLNRLLSKQKNIKQKPNLKNEKNEQHDDYLLSSTMNHNNESVSYSAVMSTSVAVRQRRPSQKSVKCDDYIMGKTQTKQKNSVQNEEEHEKTDNAFIFFRPKKGVKN